MRFYFLFFLFTCKVAISQVNPAPDEDPFKFDIEKNIVRGTITLQGPIEFVFGICFEHELRKPFTFVVKAGPSVFNKGSENQPIEFAAKASGELRYYFNLLRRIKRNKTTRNFSAAYLSLEPFVRSKALVIFDEAYYEKRPSAMGVYVNLGFQQQKRRHYVAGFVGLRFGAKGESETDVFDYMQLGIVIGRQF